MARPQQPVVPIGMDLLFYYPCPSCKHPVSVLAMVHPGMAECGHCAQRFPIMPVDERIVQYIKIMLANGKAAIDLDFA